MKTRKEAARFIEYQLHNHNYRKPDKTPATHYGYQELKQLMDFIWERGPTESECILTHKEYKKATEAQNESIHNEPFEY